METKKENIVPYYIALFTIPFIGLTTIGYYKLSLNEAFVWATLVYSSYMLDFVLNPAFLIIVIIILSFKLYKIQRNRL